MAAAREGSKPGESHTMNGGDGSYSYVKNSSLQMTIIEAVKVLMDEGIEENLDMRAFSSPTTFRIADLGCSVGPNTFFAMKNVIEAVEKKLTKSQIMEFQVFFSDHASNDFNMLFTSLSKDKTYYAAGVPGSFYGRLFPTSSLHLVYTSSAVQWLTNVPEEVLDKNHPAWNKGKIFYSHAPKNEVAMAYLNQYTRDMDKFLQARAQEIVVGGLMAVILPTRPNGVQHHDCSLNRTLETLGLCLSDMVKKGIIDEEKLDSFNLPIYLFSPEELEESVIRNGCFSIEKTVGVPNQISKLGPHLYSVHIRAIMEGLIEEHFGPEILDELFEMYSDKLDEGYFDIMSGKAIDLFVLLRRKVVD